jgi:putative transposase
VWAFDFQFDQTADGKTLKLLNVVDECTREALVMHVGRSITADQTVAVLEHLAGQRDGPDSCSLRQRAGDDRARPDRLVRPAEHKHQLHRPGRPMTEPVVESFHSRVRDELLNLELFSCLAEAQVVIEDWRVDYNQRRPHSALGRKPPAVFAAAWTPDTPTA